VITSSILFNARVAFGTLFGVSHDPVRGFRVVLELFEPLSEVSGCGLMINTFFFELTFVGFSVSDVSEDMDSVLTIGELVGVLVLDLSLVLSDSLTGSV